MLTAFVIISAVAYTLARFIVIDTVFDTPRDAVHGWLIRRKRAWALWLHELLSCTGCMCWWMSLFAVIALDHNPWSEMSIPFPVAMVFACRTGALVFAIIIDPVDDDDEDEK